METHEIKLMQKAFGKILFGLGKAIQ